MCFGLPPNGAVGGRRWTLFINELIKKEHEVFPITSAEIGHTVSSWQSQFPTGLNQLYLDYKYPKVLLSTPQTFIEKLKYRFALWRMKKQVQGNIYDPTAFYDYHVSTIVKFLKTNGINNLVVSGAPFHYFNTAKLVKEQLPELNLILEYRDIWTDSKYEYGEGIKLQSKDRYNYESSCEDAAINSANAIVVVSKDIQNRIQYRIPNKTNLHIIPNGYKVDKVKRRNNKGLDENLELIYAGSINSERDYYMILLSAIKKLKDEHSEVYDSLRIKVYNNSNPKFRDDVSLLGLDVFQFLPAISQEEMDIELAKSDYSLILKRRDELENSFPSKFFDSIKVGIPIICYSPEGEVTKFIREKNIGEIIDSNALDNFPELILRLRQNRHKYNVIGEDNQFEVKSLVNEYLKLFQSA